MTVEAARGWEKFVDARITASGEGVILIPSTLAGEGRVEGLLARNCRMAMAGCLTPQHERQVPGRRVVGGEPERLVGGAEGVFGLVVGVEGEGELIEHVGAPGEA